jgi:SAM-dependent methyltransferase
LWSLRPATTGCIDAGSGSAGAYTTSIVKIHLMNRDDWNRRYSTEELIWSDAPNRFLVSETEAMSPGRALDLACGEGRNAVWLAQRGWRVTGVDFSEVALAKARALAAARGVEVEWIAADLDRYEPPAAAFELVIVFYLQVPAASRRAILRRAEAAVAPAGLLLVVGHDSTNLERGHGGPRDPAVLYSAADVVADLERLEVERAEAVTRPVDTNEGRREAVDLLVRARAPAIEQLS